MRKYWKALFAREHSIPAMKVALVVGSVLFFINHASALIADEMTAQRWMSAILTYVVPYLVSIHGRVSST